MNAAISAPKPIVLFASCSTSTRPVLTTDGRDRLAIHRDERAQVEDLDLDAVVRERVGGLAGEVHADAVGHDRERRAGAVDAGDAERDRGRRPTSSGAMRYRSSARRTPRGRRRGSRT